MTAGAVFDKHRNDFQFQHLLNTHVWPFHEGELQVQWNLGAYEYVNSYAPRFIRSFMPDQHRQFFENQPFLVAAARDDRGLMWSTLLFSAAANTSIPGAKPFFVKSPTSESLVMTTKPLPGDALEGALKEGSDIGLLGIEFATRRRNRVNGRIVENHLDEAGEPTIRFQVDQSFGNCPQYIKPRDWWTEVSTKEKENANCLVENGFHNTTRPNRLSLSQLEEVRKAETIFVATGYRGVGQNPAFGNDAGHRGGAPGFLDVQDDLRTILIPDYNGNNHFNTIGNIVMDPRMGITIPLYETGAMIQLSGHASLLWGNEDDETARLVQSHAGAKRVIRFVIDEIVELPVGSLPIRWKSPMNQTLVLQIKRKVKETSNVTSFHLASLVGESPQLPSFHAGQHLPVSIDTTQGTIHRSYSISSFQANPNTIGEYRISVQRDPQGLASRYLHDEMQVGDRIIVDVPSGTFVYPPSVEEGIAQGSQDNVVFLSAGIGVTPVLSMLHAFVADLSRSRKAGHGIASRAVWIHSVKDMHRHPFMKEVEDLQAQAGGKHWLQTAVAYTQDGSLPLPESTWNTYQRRIDRELLASEIDLDQVRNSFVYICGPTAFVGAMETLLVELGVASNKIKHESF